MDPQRRSRLVHQRRSAIEVLGEARRQLLRPPTEATPLRQPAKREGRVLPRRDDIRGVARPPDLDERRVLPGIGRSPPDPGMEGVKRRPRDAVLQAYPSRASKRIRPVRQALLEPVGRSPVGQDLRTAERERGGHAGRLASPRTTP